MPYECGGNCIPGRVPRGVPPFPGMGAAILKVVLVCLINVAPPLPLAESGLDSANARGGASIGRSQEAAFTMSDKAAN